VRAPAGRRAALAGEGDPPLANAVMAGNTDALRFYARRGLVPGVLLLYRFRAARVDPASAYSQPP
jgi:hypothetical protein